MEQELRRIGSVVPKTKAVAVENERPGRFSAKGLASQRERLALSGLELGLLIGVSSQSIYNWESGIARPHARYLPAIAALKTLRKKDAASVLGSRQVA